MTHFFKTKIYKQQVITVVTLFVYYNYSTPLLNFAGILQSMGKAEAGWMFEESEFCSRWEESSVLNRVQSATAQWEPGSHRK